MSITAGLARQQRERGLGEPDRLGRIEQRGRSGSSRADAPRLFATGHSPARAAAPRGSASTASARAPRGVDLREPCVHARLRRVGASERSSSGAPRRRARARPARRPSARSRRACSDRSRAPAGSARRRPRAPRRLEHLAELVLRFREPRLDLDRLGADGSAPAASGAAWASSRRAASARRSWPRSRPARSRTGSTCRASAHLALRLRSRAQRRTRAANAPSARRAAGARPSSVGRRPRHASAHSRSAADSVAVGHAVDAELHQADHRHERAEEPEPAHQRATGSLAQASAPGSRASSATRTRERASAGCAVDRVRVDDARAAGQNDFAEVAARIASSAFATRSPRRSCATS